jgi:hypothetical protein
MLQAIRERFIHLVNQKKPGLTISAILTIVCFLGLAVITLLKSTSFLLLFFLSLGAYLGFIGWITFQNSDNKRIIPYTFFLVWLIPLVRILIGAGGGPRTWDEMLYMDLARTSTAEPRVLNQYFHVYLLKIFYWLCGSADFSAVRYYWISIQAIVLVLVYQSGVILTRKYSYFARIVSGLAAVLLFAAQPLVMEYVGVAYVDFTLELLFTCAALLIIVADAYPTFTRRAIFILGLLLGLGLKTKEVALVLLIPITGLAWMNRPPAINIRYFLKVAGIAVLGVLTSLIVIISLNTVIIGRPLWGLTLYDFQTWFNARTGADPGLKPYYRLSYFTELSSTASLCCILLIGLMRIGQRQLLSTRVYRILGATILSFVLLYILIPFQAYTRYLIPKYQLLAILAGPAIVEFTEGSKSRLTILLLVSLPSALLVWLTKRLIHPALDPNIYTANYFYTVCVLPILICLTILVWMVIPEKFQNIRTTLVGLFFIAAILYPISDVYESVSTQEPEKLVSERFRILRLWDPDVRKFADRQLFISERIDNPQGPLAISADYARIMINLGLDANLSGNIVTTKMDLLVDDDLNRYCFGILPTEEFDSLSANNRLKIERVFKLSQNKNHVLTYLTNPACR